MIFASTWTSHPFTTRRPATLRCDVPYAWRFLSGQLVDTVVFFKNAGTDTVDGSKGVFFSGSQEWGWFLPFPSNWFSRQISGCHQQYVKKDIDFRALPGHGGLNQPGPVWYFQICTADSSAFLRQFPQFHGCATWKLLAFFVIFIRSA